MVGSDASGPLIVSSSFCQTSTPWFHQVVRGMCVPVPATVSAAPHAEPESDPPLAGAMAVAGNRKRLSANSSSGAIPSRSFRTDPETSRPPLDVELIVDLQGSGYASSSKALGSTESAGLRLGHPM